jgi:hypothetical protein
MAEHTLPANRMTGSIRTVAVTTTVAARPPRRQEVVSCVAAKPNFFFIWKYSASIREKNG